MKVVLSGVDRDVVRDHATAAAEKLWQSSKMHALLGPPGSGKTTVTHEAIEYTLEQNGSVLFALPTNQLKARMKLRYGCRVDLDTCYSAFGFGDRHEFMPNLDLYNFDRCR